jgi:hypothetical protein
LPVAVLGRSRDVIVVTERPEPMAFFIVESVAAQPQPTCPLGGAVTECSGISSDMASNRRADGPQQACFCALSET